MNGKIYKIELELNVSGNWIEDGLNQATLKRRIKDELPGNLCPYAYGHEVFVKKINISIK